MRTSKLSSTISAFLLASSILFSASTAFAQATTSAAAPTIDPYNSSDVETAVRAAFADTPNMVAIAKCESGFRQYSASGNVLYDPTYSMIGVFQINNIHLPEALGLGMDIMALDGNIAYAKYLYQQDGTDPWMSSYGCWKSAAQSAPASIQTASVAFADSAATLSFGMISHSIVVLQQLLNRAGFLVSSSGPGSPGEETTKFGSLTREAVRRFQCAKNIVCSGDEATSGYGAVDSRTYSALAAAAGAVSSDSNAATSTSTSLDKAAEIAQVESQISALTEQLDTLNQRLNELTK